MKAQVTFKSGAQIVMDADDIETVCSPTDGRLLRITVHRPDEWINCCEWVDVNEVAAVVLLRGSANEVAS